MISHCVASRVHRASIAFAVACLLLGIAGDAMAQTTSRAARIVEPARTAPDVSRGTTHTLQLAHAPFAEHPDVLVHAPPGFDPSGPLHIALFLHGWSACVAVLASSRDGRCSPTGPVHLATHAIEQFDRAGVNALLVIPQFAYERRSSATGRLGLRNGLKSLLRELLAHADLAATLGGTHTLDQLGRVVLLAHSGGFNAAESILLQGGVDVHGVYFLDALYGADDALDDWVRTHGMDFVRTDGQPPRHLVLLYTDDGGQGGRSRRLLRRMASALPDESRARFVHDGRDGTAPFHSAHSDATLVAQVTSVAHSFVPKEFLGVLIVHAGFPRVAGRARR